jgi:hypothetical protein
MYDRCAHLVFTLLGLHGLPITFNTFPSGFDDHHNNKSTCLHLYYTNNTDNYGYISHFIFCSHSVIEAGHGPSMHVKRCTRC